MGLLEVLEPLGKVSAKSEGGRWRLHYDNVDSEFQVGKTHARVQGRDADLTGKFFVENNRGLVPVGSLGSLLPRFLGGPVTFHEESQRLFHRQRGNSLHRLLVSRQSTATRLPFHCAGESDGGHRTGCAANDIFAGADRLASLADTDVRKQGHSVRRFTVKATVRR